MVSERQSVSASGKLSEGRSCVRKGASQMSSGEEQRERYVLVFCLFATVMSALREVLKLVLYDYGISGLDSPTSSDL